MSSSDMINLCNNSKGVISTVSIANIDDFNYEQVTMNDFCNSFDCNSVDNLG